MSEICIDRYLYLAKKAIYQIRFLPPEIEKSDVENVAVLALYKARKTFRRSKKGNCFANYASQIIRWEILAFLNQWKKNSHVLGMMDMLAEVVGEDDIGLSEVNLLDLKLTDLENDLLFSGFSRNKIGLKHKIAVRELRITRDALISRLRGIYRGDGILSKQKKQKLDS